LKLDTVIVRDGLRSLLILGSKGEWSEHRVW